MIFCHPWSTYLNEFQQESLEEFLLEPLKKIGLRESRENFRQNCRRHSFEIPNGIPRKTPEGTNGGFNGKSLEQYLKKSLN